MISRFVHGIHPAWAALAVAAAGCASSGFGEETRADVTARMASIQAPVAGCYEQALGRNRKLQGTMLLAFTAEHGTGQFKDVRVARSDVPDPALEACVAQQVATQKLAKPTKTNLQIEYPLEFGAVD